MSVAKTKQDGLQTQTKQDSGPLELRSSSNNCSSLNSSEKQDKERIEREFKQFDITKKE